MGVAAWQWTQDVELFREEEEGGEEERSEKTSGGGGGSGSEAKSPKRQRWSGFVSVPASRLPAPGHLDLQAAFFAPRGAFSSDSEERWDNAGGLNWGAEFLISFFFIGVFSSRKLVNKSLNSLSLSLLSLSPPLSLSLSLSPPLPPSLSNIQGVAADVAPVSGNSEQQHRLPGLARAPPPAESARAAASLLLRLDALAARRENGALPPGSAPLLRALARAGDGPLLSAYERCRSWTDDAAVASELARAAGLRFSSPSSSPSAAAAAAKNGNRPLHVVHIASEAAPFAKVGGLADVVTALSRSNQAGGTHVELVLPKYDCGDYGSLSELRELGRISVPWGGGGGSGGNGTARRGVPTAVWGALCSGLPTYLLEPLEPLSRSSSLPPPFWRGAAYGAEDDAERFLFFAVAALEFLLWAGRSPDAVHCHDWQSASVPLLLEAGGYRRKRFATFGGGLGYFGGVGVGESESREGGGGGGGAGGSPSSSLTGDGPLATTGTVLTIHNLAFPGRMNPSVLSPAVSGMDGGGIKERERERESRERERESRERERESRGGKHQTHLSFARKNTRTKLNKKTLSGALPWDPSSPESPSWVSDAVLDREGPRGLHGGPDALLLRAGVALADATTTVSPTYSREVLSDDGGGGGGAGPGMKSALRDAASRGRFSGVLNGIDVESYDPGTDRALFARFSVDVAPPSRSISSSHDHHHRHHRPHFVHAPPIGKALCKRALYEELGLAPPPDTADGRPAPLVAVVSRLTEQKGLDLIEAGIDAAAAAGAAVVVVGTASTPEDARRFADRASRAPPTVKYVFRFDEGLARRAYAAADLLLHPSRWEPCGLAQLVALRYGCVPVVRRTGGLACTCRDLGDWGAPEHARNAFSFDGLGTEDARAAVERAVRAYSSPAGGGEEGGGRRRGEGGEEEGSGGAEVGDAGQDLDENARLARALENHWWHRELVPRCMRQEWSWARSAREYLELYRRVGSVRL